MDGGFYGRRGTPVAAAARMARRVTAFIAMVIVVIIVLAVMWRVYLHHEVTVPHEEPTIVELASQAA